MRGLLVNEEVGLWPGLLEELRLDTKWCQFHMYVWHMRLSGFQYNFYKLDGSTQGNTSICGVLF